MQVIMQTTHVPPWNIPNDTVTDNHNVTFNITARDAQNILAQMQTSLILFVDTIKPNLTINCKTTSNSRAVQ